MRKNITQAIHVCYNSTPNAPEGATMPGRCNDCQAELSIWRENAKVAEAMRAQERVPLPDVCATCTIARFRLLDQKGRTQLVMVGPNRLIQEILTLVNSTGLSNL